MPKPITALLFDFDGTLLDTNDLIIASFQYVLDKYFPDAYTRNDILPFLGPPLFTTFNTIMPGKETELAAEYREWNERMHDEMAKEFDGTSAVLKQLKETGLKMAIVSTKKNATIMKGLALLDAEDVFDVIIGLDDVKNPKPDPEPIELALRKLNVQHDEALMIGDNSHDIEGGKNAGVRTAGVSWSLKGEDYLRSLSPDYMLVHLSDLLGIVEEEAQ